MCILFMTGILTAHAQLRSFPGAEGAGGYASGGRGTASTPTRVFEVTNLTDVNSPGSLRYACSQSIASVPYRTIVFKVSGTIHLTSKLNIPANTTIAGQTAPGGGICIADYPVSISGNNVIIRYIRIRMGDRYQLVTNPTGCGVPVAPFTAACMPVADQSGNADAFGDLGHKNIIIDHCSVSWSSDEALTMYRGDSLTIQWSMVSEPLNYNYHFEPGDADFEQHGYGGIWGAQHASFHHNLIAHCRNRTPRFAGNGTYPVGAVESADFRNNVLYNWGINNIYGGDGGEYNLVNNYYKYGPNTSSGVKFKIVTVDKSVDFPYAKYYLDGNYVDGSATNTNDNWSGAVITGGTAADIPLTKVTTPFLPDYLPSSTHTALEAYDTVLKGAGCTIPFRDTLDQRIMNDVKNRTGRIIDVQGNFPHGTPYAQTVDAWPTLATGTAATDTDHDGMPDDWEDANGLNKNLATDAGIITASGYSNLENYINNIKTTPLAETPPTPPTDPGTETPASVMWPLLTDQTAQNTGDVTGSNQQLGSTMVGIVYGSTFGTVPGWQRVATTSYAPLAYDATVFLEYKITPANGKKFTAKKIELGALGGGTGGGKMAVYYSLDNFATSTAVGTCTYNSISYAATAATPVALLNTSTTPLTGQQIATFNTSIDVDPSQTLSVRIYPWVGSASKYFTSQNVNISGVTTTPGALPLTLIRFSAAANSGATVLNWQTANEINMLRFEVERSTDSRIFSALGSVAAQNNAVGANYSFKDETIKANALVYYRLKMINKDGSASYSYTITVRTQAAQQDLKLQLFPNPAAEYVTLSHDAVRVPTVVSIYNAEGRKLKSLALALHSTQTSFSIADLSKGNYFLQYTNQQQIQTLKLLKL